MVEVRESVVTSASRTTRSLVQPCPPLISHCSIPAVRTHRKSKLCYGLGFKYFQNMVPINNWRSFDRGKLISANKRSRGQGDSSNTSEVKAGHEKLSSMLRTSSNTTSLITISENQFGSANYPFAFALTYNPEREEDRSATKLTITSHLSFAVIQFFPVITQF